MNAMIEDKTNRPFGEKNSNTNADANAPQAFVEVVKEDGTPVSLVEDACVGRAVRLPFVIAYRGRGQREETKLATSKFVGPNRVCLLVRDALPEYANVRLRPDFEGMERTWKRGTVTDVIQGVGMYEVHIRLDAPAARKAG